MLANITAFGEADVIAVMRHYFSKTSTFHGDFSTYFSALTPVFSGHTSSLASDLPRNYLLYLFRTHFLKNPPFSPIILKQTLSGYQLKNKTKTNQTVQMFSTLLTVITQRYQF